MAQVTSATLAAPYPFQMLQELPDATRHLTAHSLSLHKDDESLDSSDAESLFGSSPVSPLPSAVSALNRTETTGGKSTLVTASRSTATAAHFGTAVPADFFQISLATLVGTSELLGHSLESRTSISQQQDVALVSAIQSATTTPLRDASQQPIFMVAPLDVLVTKDEVTGRNVFHIIEINGTGIAGLTNMAGEAVQAVLRSISELAAHLHQENACVIVASSGQESQPPVSRTMHEKILYIEALRRGFEATGRSCSITNMSKLERDPTAMPENGITLVLGYMKQFRRFFEVDAAGHLKLFGRQVHAAINDRFVLNTMYQFNHQVDLREFMGYNQCFTAGADKGVAYRLYNQFFGGQAAGQFGCMAPSINYKQAATRDDLVDTIQQWLQENGQPLVIKPQGTGCGHGIEFFFDAHEDVQKIAAKVDSSINTVASTYNLSCGGLPYTICEFLNTKLVADEGHAHSMKGHKFEIRIVVYREGLSLKAFPSIAKVAREAFNPENPEDKSSLINNITTSSKATSQCGSEFMLALSNHDTLKLLGISVPELTELCAACNQFIRFVIDQVQDAPTTLGLPE